MTCARCCSASRVTDTIHDDQSLARNATTVALERIQGLPTALVLRCDRRSSHRGPRWAERIDRLVLLSKLRLGLGVRVASRYDAGRQLSDHACSTAHIGSAVLTLDERAHYDVQPRRRRRGRAH